MSLHPAARVTDRFGHNAQLQGMLAGIAVGALIGLGIVATGGLGAIAAGAAVATTGIAGLLGDAIGSAMAGPETGALTVGSFNVFINDLPATMVQKAMGECLMHGEEPLPVATGSAAVFINGLPASRVTDLLVCGAMIRSGSPNVFIGGPRQSPVCSALRGQQNDLARFAIDAQAAAAAYDPPETRKAPDGYRNATTEDLTALGLSQDMLEHPLNRSTNPPTKTEFRAAVFINKRTNAPLVAFKGTSPFSGEDWNTNIRQGLGQNTFYYQQAQKIATNVAESPAGVGARLTGHSLGGGMASAASEASGLPATTFNAAGLNARTVPHPVPSNIDAIYVKGEILRASQSIPAMPKSAATRTWPLDAADYWKQAAVVALTPLGPWALGAGIAVRSGMLHMMGAVDDALAQKRASVAQSLIDNGCE